LKKGSVEVKRSLKVGATALNPLIFSAKACLGLVIMAFITIERGFPCMGVVAGEQRHIDVKWVKYEEVTREA